MAEVEQQTLNEDYRRRQLFLARRMMENVEIEEEEQGEGGEEEETEQDAKRELNAEKRKTLKEAQNEVKEKLKKEVEKQVKKAVEKTLLRVVNASCASTIVGIIVTYVIWSIQFIATDILKSDVIPELALWEKICWGALTFLLIVLTILAIILLFIAMALSLGPYAAAVYFGSEIISWLFS